MSQFNNINYLKLEKNLLLRSTYTSRAVTSSDKLFHATLKNDANKENNWVNDRLKTQNLTATALLFRIFKKETPVPPNLLLHLVFKSLIEHGADVHAKRNGYTPLHWASVNGQLETAQLLIEHGADKNAKDHDGLTPLHYTSENGQLKTAKLLIEHGADVKAKGNHGETTLHWASQYGHLDIAKLLIEHGVDLDTKIITFFKDNDSFKDTIIKRINKLNPQKLNSNQILANRELNIVNGQNKKKYFI